MFRSKHTPQPDQLWLGWCALQGLSGLQLVDLLILEVSTSGEYVKVIPNTGPHGPFDLHVGHLIEQIAMPR